MNNRLDEILETLKRALERRPTHISNDIHWPESEQNCQNLSNTFHPHILDDIPWPMSELNCQNLLNTLERRHTQILNDIHWPMEEVKPRAPLPRGWGLPCGLGFFDREHQADLKTELEAVIALRQAQEDIEATEEIRTIMPSI